MKQQGRGMNRFTDLVTAQGEAIPGVPLIEIAGDRRLLIENHCGILEYGTERIMIRVKYGSICLLGCGLNIARMTRDQLVIFGRIDSVTLSRRCP